MPPIVPVDGMEVIVLCNVYNEVTPKGVSDEAHSGVCVTTHNVNTMIKQCNESTKQ